MKAAGACDVCRLTDWMFCECAEGTGRDKEQLLKMRCPGCQMIFYWFEHHPYCSEECSEVERSAYALKQDNAPAKSVLMHLHTESPYTYWVREDGGQWRWVEVESPEHVWELVGDGELFVSPVPWPLHACDGRLIQVLSDDRGPDGMLDVARLSFLPMSVVPE